MIAVVFLAGFVFGVLSVIGAAVGAVASGHLTAPRAPHGPHAGCCYRADGTVAKQHVRSKREDEHGVWR